MQERCWEYLILQPLLIPTQSELKYWEEWTMLRQPLASLMRQANITYVFCLPNSHFCYHISIDFLVSIEWASQGARYSLSRQVVNFESTLDQLRTMMGSNVTNFLAKSIAIMVFGSNDYINNYLMPSIYSSSYTYSPSEFANLLLNHYGRQLLVKIRNLN